MTTQISNLTAGFSNQFLNPSIDYSKLRQSTLTHAGSNVEDVAKVWDKITSENPDYITIGLCGQMFTLAANWSRSKKSVSYSCAVSNEFITIFGLVPTQKKQAFLRIDNANNIKINNGGKSWKYICPSLITIIG